MTNDSSESAPRETADILVIGGGINGVGIARDAAGRGLNVVLCEKDDLAQHTSSSSTKLIHGGLRYLEYYDFPLVRHALREREVLLKSAPHIIWPMRFLLPHHKVLRPRWLIRLGLFLYDHIGGRRVLPASWGVDFRSHVGGEALKPEFTHGFEYSDCWVQDARLVVLTARDAQNHGAQILTHTRCTALDRETDHWMATLTNSNTGETVRLRTRAVVNAAGPWVEQTLHLDDTVDSDSGVRLVKGSHIVVPKLFDHPYPYIFQNADKRVLFAIPFEGDFSLLGTTDIEIHGDPDDISIQDSEVSYICDAINQYMKKPVKASDVVWSYTGVRPLFDDHSKNASKVTRDYVLQLDDDGPPILSVFGGKITTYRKLSEQVVDMLKKPMRFKQPRWTEGAILPGGDIENGDFDAFLARCRQKFLWLDDTVLQDYARNYGSEIDRLLGECSSMDDLGENFGGGLFECEVVFLMKYEWAETADDILWRRSKKGLRVPEGTDIRLQTWMNQHQEK
ncbi:MAG: glycerol-3-phosphate dehydrogenase [Gammaproteobacteria bacterium]